MPSSPDLEQDGRSSKRQRSSLTNTDMAQLNHADPVAEDVVDIVSDGDVLLDLSGLAGVQKEVSLRVSGRVISLASPVLRENFAMLQVLRRMIIQEG
ncbi:hypothetical protein KC345_g3873 [Hortaea werneckii]|nr:hypothetical protein KC345_g3873 [Hortaea werneckii]